MLGYVKPDQEELKLREVREYRAYYCALCSQLQREFGLLFRLILSNDCTFLLICLNALADAGRLVEKSFRCPGKLFHKRRIRVDPDALHFAACINFYLFLKKLEDGVRDSTSRLKRGMLRRILRHLKRKCAFRGFLTEYAGLLERMDAGFAALDALEREPTSFDDLTNQFGSILSALADGFYSTREEPTPDGLRELLFNVGKWAYVADALDDFAEDQKNGSFNLLRLISAENSEKGRLDYAAWFLLLVQKKCAAACAQLPWRRSEGLVQNILFAGTAKCLKTLAAKQERDRRQ